MKVDITYLRRHRIWWREKRRLCIEHRGLSPVVSISKINTHTNTESIRRHGEWIHFFDRALCPRHHSPLTQNTFIIEELCVMSPSNRPPIDTREMSMWLDKNRVSVSVKPHHHLFFFWFLFSPPSGRSLVFVFLISRHSNLKNILQMKKTLQNNWNMS